MVLFKKPNINELKKKNDVKRLINALHFKKDWEIRRNAADALGELRDERAVGTLIKSLSDIDYVNVIREGMAYIDLGNEIRTEPYIADIVLEDRGRYVRQSAAKALGQIGDTRAVVPLIQALEDKDSKVRQRVSWALGEIGDKRAVEPLIQTLKDEDSRYDASDALAKIGKPAVGPLIQALKHKDKVVQEWAAWALGKIGDKKAVESLKQALKDEEEIVRGAAEEALKKIKAKGKIKKIKANVENVEKMKANKDVEGLIKTLKEDEDVRWKATTALSKIGRDAVPQLIKALDSENFLLRKHAAAALGWPGNKDAVSALTNLLEDANWELRGSAVDALGDIGSSLAIEPLVAKLNDNDWRVRKRTVDALRKIGVAGAIKKPLETALNDENEYVREAAKYALEKLRKNEGK